MLSFTVALSQAQPGGSCPDIVNRALLSLGDNCAGVGRNEACYGYDLVSAQFNVEVPDGFFSRPSDRASIFDMAKIQTAQLSIDKRQWGIGLLSLQANVPNSLPGQAVTFVLIGNVELENAVMPDQAHIPADPIPLTALRDAGVRSEPSARSNVIASLASGQSADVDGQSADGAWVRVTVGDRVGWVERAALSEADLSALPTLDGTQRMPMQAFYLRTGIGRPECAEATNDVLLVQGPKTFKVDLTINGAKMELGSTVLYRIIGEGDTMEIIVIDGEVRVEGGGEDGEDLIITTGQRSQVCLDDPDDRGVDGEANDREVSCPFSKPEDVPPGVLGQQWCLLENVSPDVLNYPVDLDCDKLAEALPTPRPVVATKVEPSATPTATSSVIQNWCDPGGPWFGKCDDPDPAIRDWYYKAGWYFAQADAGNISPQDIPPQYNPPTSTPDVGSNFNIAFLCNVAMKIVWSGLPAGATLDVSDWTVNSSLSPGTGATGLNTPSGVLGNGCTIGSYSATYSVTGTFNTSGSLSSYCYTTC